MYILYSNIQIQCSDSSSLTCCLHITVVLHSVSYQVKLNLRSKRNAIFQFKKSSTNNFGLRTLASDWFLYSVAEI